MWHNVLKVFCSTYIYVDNLLLYFYLIYVLSTCKYFQEPVGFRLIALSHLVAETCTDPGIAFWIWNTCEYRSRSPMSALVLCLRSVQCADHQAIRQSTSALVNDLDLYPWVFQIQNAIPGSVQVSATRWLGAMSQKLVSSRVLVGPQALESLK